MKKTALTLALILALLFSAVAGTQLVKKAMAETITVPDDYATIQDAINAANEGDTIFVKKGTYEEKQLVINTSLSLIGEDAENTRIRLNPPYVEKNIFTYTYSAPDNSIKVNANDFEIFGFTIATAGGYISITGERIKILSNNITTGLTGSVNETQIMDNIIYGGVNVEGSNQTIAQNVIKEGIEVKGGHNKIVDNTVSGNGLQVIDVAGNVTLILNNTINGNGWPGIHLEYGVRDNVVAQNNLSDCGIDLETRCSFNTICANRLDGAGFSLMGFNNTFFANEVIDVNIGGTHGGSIDAADNSFYHNNFLGGAPELRVYTKAPGLLVWDNGGEGNYWSSYNGTDANSDGIGDVPYTVNAAYSYYDGAVREEAIVDCGQDNYPLMAPFDVSTVDIELPEWAYPLQSPSPSPSLEPDSTSAPFPTALIIALVITSTVEGIGLLIFFKKRKR